MKGSIRKRSDSSWSLIIDAGKNPATGKRQQKWITVQGSKREAERELARLLNEVNTGAFVEPTKVTVAEYLDRWLVDYAETHVGPKTLERYRGMIALHLKPAFGQLPLAKLQPLHIQSHYSKCLKCGRKDGRDGGLSAQTVLHHHRLLHCALKMAVRWQLLARNPADAVAPPKVQEREVDAIAETAAMNLIEAATGTRLRVPIVIAIACGLRRGEILALQWADVDWLEARLTVRRSLEETKAGIHFKEPKSRRGRRTIALPLFALEILKDHRRKQQEIGDLLGPDYCDGDLICSSEDGSIWKPSAFTSAYRDLLRRRKLQGPNFHALRHSHASHLLRAGVDAKVISERLGHSRVAFTLDTYTHLKPSQDAEAARRIDAAMKSARRPAKFVSNPLAKADLRDENELEETRLN